MSKSQSNPGSLEGLTVTLRGAGKAVLGPRIGIHKCPRFVYPEEHYYCNVITPNEWGIIETSRVVYQETQGKYNNIVFACHEFLHPDEYYLPGKYPSVQLPDEGNPTSHPGRQYMPIFYILKYSGTDGVALILYDISRLSSEDRALLAKKSKNSETLFYANLFESFDAEKQAYYSNHDNFSRKVQ